MSTPTTTTPSAPTHPTRWSTIKKSLQSHHNSVNAAYEIYHSAGTPTATKFTARGSAASTPATTPRASVESRRVSQDSQASRGSSGSVGNMWGKVKKAAKEHNKSVNQAFALHYGVSAA